MAPGARWGIAQKEVAGQPDVQMCRCADGQVFPPPPPDLYWMSSFLAASSVRPHTSFPFVHARLSFASVSVVVLFLPLPAPALLDDPQPRSPSQQSPLLSSLSSSSPSSSSSSSSSLKKSSILPSPASPPTIPPDLTPRRNLSRVPLVPGLPGKSGQALSSPPIPRAIPRPHLHKHVP